MRHLLDRKILFFGGKGGVGKTTCSAAIALAASREGRRVLLVSTDPAHSTSDIFEREIGPEPRAIRPNLDALEIDPDEAARRYVDAAKTRLSGLFSPGVVRAAARQIELAASMPGVADAALFDRMAEIVETRGSGHDLVVFDTAPTGHSLRLLRMPELMAAWIDALARRRRQAAEAEQAAHAADHLARSAPSPASPSPPPGPAGGDAVLGLLETRAARLAGVRDAFQRGAEVGFVLVLIPERLPIEETARAAHLLEESHIAVAGVVVNRVLPASAEGAYFRARKAQERVYLDEIGRRFSAWPVVEIPQLESDVHGLAALERVGRHLLAGRDGRRVE